MREQEFARRLRGYDPEEVHRFLELVAVDLEGLEGECGRLARRVAELEDQLAGFHDMERSLREAMVLASEAGETARKRAAALVSEAEGKQQSLIREAERRCREIIGEAEARRHELGLEIEALESRRSYVLSRLRSLIDDQRAVVEAHGARSETTESPVRVVPLPAPKSESAVGER
jgi:cell division initiation protein